jgi:hypothetical protein
MKHNSWKHRAGYRNKKAVFSGVFYYHAPTNSFKNGDYAAEGIFAKLLLLLQRKRRAA